MRFSSLQTLLSAVVGVVIVYSLWLLSGNSTLTTYRTALRQIPSLQNAISPQSLQQYQWSRKPPAPLNNPYREWFWIWQEQNHTHTVVVASMKKEDTKWLEELSDIKQAVYMVDDDTAPLQVPQNKGNEAMVYLTYIIDNYDNLPDVSTFLHNHASAWHISHLLNGSTTTMVKRLSLEKVVREGYVNLRCDMDPGCPISAELDRLDDEDNSSHMNAVMVSVLPKLGLELTRLLATPCCAQFALSRDAIQQHPIEYYHQLRNWILTTDYPSSLSGRVFEYAWHYIFTAKPVFCPNEQICFCDAYSICFPGLEAWELYTSILKGKEALVVELMSLADNSTRRPIVEKMIGGLQDDADLRKAEAIAIGSTPVGRQEALHSAWEQLKTRGQLHNF